MKGFTLIELTISIGLLAVVLTLTGGILLNSTRVFNKQSALQEVERNGDYVIRIIEDSIRKADNVQTDASGYLIVDVPDIANPGNTLKRYFGLVQNPITTACDKNYIFMTENDLTNKNAESSKLTKDTTNGVKVTAFTTQFYSGNPTQVFVRMDIESCSDSSVRKSFQTFITARGTYK